MTTILSAAGQHIGQFDNLKWSLTANPFGVRRILAGALNVNVNSATTDWQVPMGYLSNFTGATAQSSGTASPPSALPYIAGNWLASQNFVVEGLLLNNASVSLTTATAGLFTAVAAGGVTLVTSAALSTLTAAAVGSAGSSLSMTIAATSTLLSQTSLYFRVGTAQGAAATVDVYIIGTVFP